MTIFFTCKETVAKKMVMGFIIAVELLNVSHYRVKIKRVTSC